MAGFRRVDAELLAKYRLQPQRVMALLELDSDHFRDRVRPTREYARLWAVTHKVARTIVAEYLRSVAEWRTFERAQRGHSTGTSRAHRPVDFARERARRWHTRGTARAQPGHTTIETETDTQLGAPPQKGGPPIGGAQFDPDAEWSPPGELNWRAKQVAEHLADLRKEAPRDMIRIRHSYPESDEVTG